MAPSEKSESQQSPSQQGQQQPQSNSYNVSSNFRGFGSPEKFRDTINKMKSSKPVIDTANPNSATEDQVRGFIKVVERRVELQKLSPDDQATLGPGICELLQKGAVSPKFDKSRKSELFAGNLTAGTILDSLKDVDRGLTPRKLARALRSEILEISQTWSIPGNLSKKYSQTHPDATINELVWASDFHTFSDDPNMPEEVRDWLIENYTSRFDKKK